MSYGNDGVKLTEKYTQQTIDRKVMFAQNEARKIQLVAICKSIDFIEGDRSLDDDDEATIKLMSLKESKKRELAAWRQFRTKNGLSNDALIGA